MPISSLFLISFFVLLFDQATKYAADIFLVSRETWPVASGIFHLTLVHNSGAAFGFLKGGSVFFIGISISCIVAICCLLKNRTLFYRFFACDAHDRWIQCALGLILGGALGNLVDRLRFSYVVDFLDFRIWPVFNLADSAITVGGIIIFFKMLKKDKNSKHQIMIND